MATRTIAITAGTISVSATLNATRTAQAVWDALPVDTKAQTIGVDLPEEKPQAVVELGDLGYWPPGQAFCMFFGRTPASTGDEIRPASPVNVLGRMQGDLEALKKVRSGARVRIERS
jgi:hypothetical protein